MKPRPCIPVSIDGIVATREDSIRVRIGDKLVWLSRDDIDFAPGAVILPVWLAKKTGVCHAHQRSH